MRCDGDEHVRRQREQRELNVFRVTIANVHRATLQMDICVREHGTERLQYGRRVCALSGKRPRLWSAKRPPRSVRSLEAILARQPTWPHYGAPLHLCLHGPTVTHPRHTTCRLHLPRHTIYQGRDTTALSVQSHITTLSLSTLKRTIRLSHPPRHACVRRDGLLRPGTGPPRRVRPCRPLSGAALCWDEETLCPHCELIPHVLGGSFSVVPDPISPTTVSIYLLMLGT